MKVVRKGGEELGLVGVVEIHYIYTVYNFGPYLGLLLSILSAVWIYQVLYCILSISIYRVLYQVPGYL